VVIYTTADVTAISGANRLDAVGFGTNSGGVCDLLREGTNLGATLDSTLQYTFFRDQCAFSFPSCTINGSYKDTNDNAADFRFADTAATLVSGAGFRLGVPGP
jgi:hypothetical protein